MSTAVSSGHELNLPSQDGRIGPTKQAMLHVLGQLGQGEAKL